MWAQSDGAGVTQPANAAVPAAAQSATIKGTVKAGKTPLPGVAVTATDTLTGKKYATTTDIDGVYQMQVPRSGRYLVKTELMGFAATTQEVVVNPAGASGSQPAQAAEFNMDLASRAAPQAQSANQPETATARNPAGTSGTAGSFPRRGAQGTVARVGRGTQALNIENNADADTLDATTGQGNVGVQGPSLGDVASTDSSAADSIAVSGQPGQINGLAGFSEDELRNRIRDMQGQGFTNGDIAGAFMGAMQSGNFGGPGAGPGGGPGGPGGGFGGGGGRGFGGASGRGGFGGGGFRGFRGQNPNAWHGTVAYNGSDSALDAIPFSVTGTPVAKPPSDTNTLIASFAGTPFIPHLTTPNPKQFVFFTVQEQRNTRSTIAQAIVPTAAERSGDFSTLGQTIYAPSAGLSTACLAAGVTPGAAFPNNIVPAACISPAATALLNYYPLPNITPTGTQDNFQTITTGTTHSSQVSARYNRSFGAAPVRGGRGGFGGFGRNGGGGQNRNLPPTLRQSIAENFAYSHSANSSANFSPQLGGKGETNGYSFTSSYTVGYGRLNSTASLGWNRSVSTGSNYFTDGPVNPAVAAGIYVANPTIYGNPFYFGVPTVSLTGLSGLSDARPSDAINQTITFSDFVSWSHKRHNLRFGFDFHRIHADSIGGTNVLGAFTFSGAVTQDPIADLLIGQPQQTAVTAGLNKIYLRGNSWDWYAQDDWRARSNLTFNYGLRWEYFSPYSEKYNHLVNLNLAGSGSGLQISNVCATAAAGCAAVGTPTLVNPDKAMYSPRVGIAWQPKFKFTKQTVVRASYGINYNTGQYSRFAANMSFQQPFAITQTNTLTTAASPTTCTTANMSLNIRYQNSTGFNCSTQVTQSNFGVNPNYRLGMVQAYNFGIQRTLPEGIVLNIGYSGAYAGNLDMLRAPNRTAKGVIDPTSGQFYYEDSLGYQRSNSLYFGANKRMQKGVAMGATYTYAHSIDDASSVGGSGNSIAQDDQNLAAEESNSSFDRRHSLTGNFVIEPPFGPNRAFFNKGNWVSKVLDGYSVSGQFTFASGGWATPTYIGTAQEIAAGANSLRPNRVPGTSISGAETLKHWFNTGAFAGLCDPRNPQAYCLQPGSYGNASRNSIELPGTVSINGSLSRTFSLGETRNLEMRITAANALNTVQYSGVDTSVNSRTFGQVIGAAGMRSFTYQARYRF